MATRSKTGALRTWTIDGTQEDGTPETTVVEIRRNDEWTPADRDEQSRYLVVVLVEGDEEQDDTADSKADALDVAEGFVEWVRDEYDMRLANIRDERSAELDAVGSDWYMDDMGTDTEHGADRAVVEAIAALIANGRGRDALAALRSAGLAD